MNSEWKKPVSRLKMSLPLRQLLIHLYQTAPYIQGFFRTEPKKKASAGMEKGWGTQISHTICDEVLWAYTHTQQKLVTSVRKLLDFVRFEHQIQWQRFGGGSRHGMSMICKQIARVWAEVRNLLLQVQQVVQWVPGDGRQSRCFCRMTSSGCPLQSVGCYSDRGILEDSGICCLQQEAVSRKAVRTVSHRLCLPCRTSSLHSASFDLFK